MMFYSIIDSTRKLQDVLQDFCTQQRIHPDGVIIKKKKSLIFCLCNIWKTLSYFKEKYYGVTIFYIMSMAKRRGSNIST